MGHITLNQGLRRIEVSNLEIENDLAFEHFDRLPADRRDAEFIKAAISCQCARCGWLLALVSLSQSVERL